MYVNYMEQKQEFKSLKNKGLLWELMSNESKEFRTGTSKNLNEIKSLFETCLDETFKSKINDITTSLLDLNKLFITNFTHKIKSISQPYQNYLSKDIKSSRIEKINNELQEKKNEMESFLKTKKPDEIDFSSSNDSPLTNVDDILKKKLEERNYDLTSISNKSKETEEKAKSWIGLENSQLETQDIKLENEIISNNPINNSTFQSTENSLFSKLKPEEQTFFSEQNEESNHNPDIHHLLNLILANQKKIMQKLDI